MASKIIYPRGTTYTFTHNYQINGVPATTGQKLFFTAKQSVDDDPTDTSSNLIVKKTIVMSGSSNPVTINPVDVPDSIDAGNYVWDLKVLDSIMGIILLESGTFQLVVTATNRTS